MAVSVAILGCGVFARDTYVPTLFKEPLKQQFTIKAIFSHTEESAAKMKAFLHDNHDHHVDSYHGDEGLAAVLARTDIQAVFVVVPIHVLASTVKACLAAGKHVLSEKPIAVDSNAARDLIAWHGLHAPHLFWGVAENYR